MHGQNHIKFVTDYILRLRSWRF